MNRLTENKIVLIIKKTRLDEIIVRFNTLDQAKFYVEHLGSDFKDYQAEDQCYKHAVNEVEQALTKLGRVHTIERAHIQNYIFGKSDTVVVLGQDGLVANTLKYLDGQPVVAINPDPDRWDGVLLPFKIQDITRIIQELFQGKRQFKEITFAKIALNNGQYLYGVNDLFIGPKSHTSARYTIKIDNQEEQQSSSGIIISTGLGSTGWMKSVLAGANGVVEKMVKYKLPKANAFDWSSDYLCYSVREPFPSNVTGTNLVFGKVTKNTKMTLTSMMASNGVIFSDGIESDFIEFNSGAKAIVSVGEKKGFLVF